MGISLGLVGLGAFGSAFAELFKCHPRVDRVALCDREPERIAQFAEKPSFQDKFKPADAYEDFEEICKADLDALVIITQPWLHAPQAIQAMECGKSVYSAVPIIYLPDGDEILDWCDRLIDACRRTGMSYMLGETSYYHSQAMYCRRRAAERAFGDFVYAEGEYIHPHDLPACDLREVRKARLAGAAGREWTSTMDEYVRRGVLAGPMHYPTHSVSGPMSVMRARAEKVCAWGWRNRTGDEYFFDVAFSNETGLFRMSNGAALRVCEYREAGYSGSDVFETETFRLFGTEATFCENTWIDKTTHTPLTVEQMRDPLPQAFLDALTAGRPEAGVYGGHGGSHAYLVNEFVEAVAGERRPAINAWEAVRYVAAGVAAHKSALRDGELLDVPDWGDAPA